MSAVETVCVCGLRQSVPSSPLVTIHASTGKPYRYRTCDNCGHMVIAPMPTSEELSTFYDAAYYGAGSQKFPRFLDALRGFFLAGRARISNRIVRQPVDVLDVGCGDGRYLRAMGASGHRTHGTEMVGPAFDRAARIGGIHLRPPPLTTNTFASTRFGLVTAWHVLEHVPAPEQLVHTIHSVLRADGKLIVEVPNTASWHGRMTGTAAFSLDPPRHLHQFTERSLRALLDQNGFVVDKIETISFEMGVMGFVQSILNCFIQPRDLFYDVLRSRGRCSGPISLKVSSAIFALPLIPIGFIWTLAESVAGHGPVLRATCSMNPQYERR
jgi:2-polyprenyl-3-methyl-5-hydroxy-6-metoxy-1,4-benzoquinol methylase